MLTPARIARLAQAREWDRLLRDVLANGRPLPASAAARLAESSCVRATAAALGLCRTLELSRVSFGPDRSPARDHAPRELLDALRDGAGSDDPVARAFAQAGLAAVGEEVGARAPGERHPSTKEEESRGALSGEGSPLDALLTVWALGGVFVCSPNTLVERPDLHAAFENASRAINAMHPRDAHGADLRVLRALASVALRRSSAMRPAA